MGGWVGGGGGVLPAIGSMEVDHVRMSVCIKLLKDGGLLDCRA